MFYMGAFRSVERELDRASRKAREPLSEEPLITGRARAFKTHRDTEERFELTCPISWKVEEGAGVRAVNGTTGSFARVDFLLERPDMWVDLANTFQADGIALFADDFIVEEEGRRFEWSAYTFPTLGGTLVLSLCCSNDPDLPDTMKRYERSVLAAIEDQFRIGVGDEPEDAPTDVLPRVPEEEEEGKMAEAKPAPRFGLSVRGHILFLAAWQGVIGAIAMIDPDIARGLLNEPAQLIPVLMFFLATYGIVFLAAGSKINPWIRWTIVVYSAVVIIACGGLLALPILLPAIMLYLAFKAIFGPRPRRLRDEVNELRNS